MADSQSQKAGANSTQMQVHGDYNVHQGMSPVQAIEVIQFEADKAAAKYHAIGASVVRERLDAFGMQLMTELSRLDALNILSDPSFQALLYKAQIHAAAADGEDDHELLAKLLGQRAQEDRRVVRAAVSRAVDVVDVIEPGALTALTALWFTFDTQPTGLDAVEVLQARDQLASRILDSNALPYPQACLDMLDMLGCVRFDNSGTRQLKKWEDITFRRVPGHVSRGLDEADAAQFRERLNAIRPGLADLIGSHPFLPERQVMRGGSSSGLLAMAMSWQLDESQTADLNELAIDSGIDQTDDECTQLAVSLISGSFSNLNQIREWFNNIEGSVELTAIGRALAYANAKRLDGLMGFPTLSEFLTLRYPV